jgi:hypothetical protein
MADGDETAAINSLIDDLSGPEQHAHLATVNTVEWLQELKADNQNFVLTS